MRLKYYFLLLILALSPCFAGTGKGVSSSRAVKMVAVRNSKREKHDRLTPNRPHQAHPLIILDAGHGGKDHGAKVDSVLEKRLSLSTVLLLKKALEGMGYRVVLTRSHDVALPLARRVGIANQMDATLFVSIHFNSAANSAAKGVEVFYYASKTEASRAKESKHLANCVIFQVIDQTAMVSRGVKTGNLYVNREAAMPSILVEGGFMTNPEELAKLKDKEFLNKLACGVARGVDKYLKS